MKVVTRYEIDSMKFQTKYKKVIIFPIQNELDIAFLKLPKEKITKGMGVVRVKETLHGKLIKEFTISNARLQKFIRKHNIELATIIRR